MAVQDRESGGPILQVSKNSERGTPDAFGVCGGKNSEVGEYMDGQRILCGSDEVPERRGVAHAVKEEAEVWESSGGMDRKGGSNVFK